MLILCTLINFSGTGKQGSTSSAVTDTTVNILPFTELSAGGSCTATQHPTCAALDLSVLPWQLHANHEYYVSIKAENAIGLFTIATSSVYKHDVTMATGGLIFDVKTNGNIMASIQILLRVKYFSLTKKNMLSGFPFLPKRSNIHYL